MIALDANTERAMNRAIETYKADRARYDARPNGYNANHAALSAMRVAVFAGMIDPGMRADWEHTARALWAPYDDGDLGAY